MIKIIKIYYFILIILFSLQLNAEIDVKIKYSGKNSSIPQLTRKIINKNYQRYENFLGLEEDLNMNCIIVTNKEELLRELGHQVPEWLAGVMDYRKNRIVLKSPKFENISHEQYESTIKHELVHFMQNSVVPLSITPNWFDEGVAEYLVKRHTIRSQIILSRALNREKLIPLDELNFAFSPNRTKSQLAYAESSSLIDFLMIAYGEEIIKDILTNIKAGQTFSRAWFSATGMEYEHLDFHWQKYIKKRYKWIFLLDFKYLIWLIMPVILIIAFIIKKITNQEIINEWDEESENEENKISPEDDIFKTFDNNDLSHKSD